MLKLDLKTVNNCKTNYGSIKSKIKLVGIMRIIERFENFDSIKNNSKQKSHNFCFRKYEQITIYVLLNYRKPSLRDNARHYCQLRSRIHLIVDSESLWDVNQR
jgi:hypothetical protein